MPLCFLFLFLFHPRGKLKRKFTGSVRRSQKTLEEHHADKDVKRQAIVSIDYVFWEQLINAFSITEPLIPHREPQNRDIGRTGWYG